MRMMIMFDLPTNTKDQRRAATQFRNNLIKQGFYMIQYSVYGRLCNGHDSVKKYKKRLQSVLPLYGSIRLITITEKQFTNADILLGTKIPSDKDAQWHQLTFL
ncbi:MAG: CRISPR-associated endonuclease Cas2 [Firmicutes bacterium]|nr:CRISPR-associated endonuclease Cas2 [Bacillota bacterium]MCL1953781.1 CRISPR-associated endonuclease Cas2 [Bacillota bacterium]